MNTAWPPRDTLYLWYLGDPGQARLVGELNLVMAGRGVSLRYAADWLRHGFALSEDLPLVDIEHFPSERDTAAGAVDDARPDRWGERVIRALDRPQRLSLMEYLYFAGDDRFGALGVSESREHYLPRQPGPLPRLAEVAEIHGLALRILAGTPVNETLRRLIEPGATMGGARPKGLIRIGASEWVVKFAEDPGSAEPLIEHATMRLAERAGITVGQTRALRLPNAHAVAIKRFDRRDDGTRRHALSAHVALRAIGSEPGYPQLAELLRRRGVAASHRHRDQMHELFRRLVFNILIDNTDDHEKNHVLLTTDGGELELAPAFDVLPTCQSLGYQSMMVGTAGAESSIDNALSMAASYWLDERSARAVARSVAEVVANWRAHFARHRIGKVDLEQLARHIDRPALRSQRDALLAAQAHRARAARQT